MHGLYQATPDMMGKNTAVCLDLQLQINEKYQYICLNMLMEACTRY